MRRSKIWTAFMLTAAMLFQPVSMPGISAKAAEGMLTDEQLSSEEVTAPEAWGATPNEAQRYYQTQGLAAFCHFGPNTFNNVEWGENYPQEVTDSLFTLSEDFDADTIVKTLKDAGFSRLLITAKHHDGFCIWASDLTDYDISSTQYKNGQGDILEEISDACTKYNMDMGLYLSPWDIHEDKYGCYGDSKEGDYNQLYTDWIREICTAKKADGSYKYGNNNPNRRTDRFIEWWMDGATGTGSSYQTYDWQGIFDAIRETNPTCQIFGTHMAGVTSEGVKLGSTGGVNWIGNEDGYAHDETWSKVIAGENYESIRKDGYIKGYPNGDTWSVPECDAKMLSSGWFWSSTKEGSLRSMQNLAEMYYRSVGHGATLLLNVSPNSSGTLDENQKNRVIEFGQAVRDSFAEDLTKTQGVTASATSVWGNAKAYSPVNVLDTVPEGELYDETYWSAAEGETTGTLEIRFNSSKTFNTVSIEEYIPKGQKISSFSVEYQENGIWKEFDTGATIGSKRLCRGPEVTAEAIRINILSALSTPMISNVGVYKTTDEFAVDGEKEIELPTNLQWLDISNFTLTGEWGTDNYDDGTVGKWSDAGKNGVAEFTFTGTKAWLSGTVDPGHGTVDVYIDGNKVGTADTYNDERKLRVIIYETPDLEYGTHTVRMVITNKALGLYGAYYQDGSGIFEIEKEQYKGAEKGTVDIKIVRKLGSIGEASVTYSTPSGGAEQGVNYQYLNDTVTFAEGETEKTITVQINYSPKVADGLNFYFVLDSVEGASLGSKKSANVVIKDIDAERSKEELENILELAGTKLEGSYESESYREFVKVREEALNIYYAAAPDQKALNDAVIKLEIAMSRLKESSTETVPADDRQELQNLVGKSEQILADSSRYTEESLKAYEKTVVYASGILENESATQNDVNYAQKILEKAEASLVLSEAAKEEIKKEQAKTELKSAVDKVQSYYTAGKGNYTDESWAAFEKAYLAAVNPDIDADSAALNQLKKNLEQAYAGLKIRDAVATLSAPDVTKIVSTVKGVKITFSASANSSLYEIYRKQGNGQPVKAGSTTSLSFTDEKPVGGKKLTYMVKAVSGDVNKYQSSGYGAEKNVTLPKAPGKVTVKAVSNGVKVTVKPVKGAKKYIILRSTKKDGSYKQIKKISGKKKITYLDKKAKKGKKYFYKAVAVKGKYYSPAKASKAVKVKK